MTTQNINEKIRELKELTRMAEEIEAEQEAIKDELKKETARLTERRHGQTKSPKSSEKS